VIHRLLCWRSWLSARRHRI